ncbi:MAG: hypothetical protein OET63_18540 [Desulfobacterales bacterium]|jgi:hypothetical protein|nr:hypothetical protein [Desulfobacterales bacterium]
MKYRVLLISGFICWGGPLLAATIGLFAYWQTHAQLLVNIGFLLLVIGFILGLVGIGCVLLFLLLNMRSAEPTRQKGRRNGFIGIGLILLNIPLALLYSLVGGHLASQIYLEIVNDSPYRLNQVVIISAAYRLDLGELEPGEQIDTYYHPKAESDVKIQIVSNDQVKEATISGYAAMFGLDDSRIIITTDSEIIIQKLKP